MKTPEEIRIAAIPEIFEMLMHLNAMAEYAEKTLELDVAMAESHYMACGGPKKSSLKELLESTQDLLKRVCL